MALPTRGTVLTVAMLALLTELARPAHAVAAEPGGRLARAREFHGKWFSIALPAGWKRKVPTPCGKGILGGKLTACEAFSTGGGDFFIVVVDFPATELTWMDASWRLERSDDGRGIKVAAAPAPCSRAERAACMAKASDESDQELCCPAGDGSLNIDAMGPAVIPAHDLWFWFGNGKREEGVPLEPFVRLLESFRARPHG